MKIGSILKEALAVLDQAAREKRETRRELLKKREDIQFALALVTREIDGLQDAINLICEEGDKI